MSNVNAIAPAIEFEVVIPSDTNPQPGYRSIRADTAGTIVMTDARDVQTTLNLVAGEVLAVRPKLILTTSTATLFGYLRGQ